MNNWIKIAISGVCLGLTAWGLSPLFKQQPSQAVHASWVFQANNLSEAKNEASDIVLAKVVKIEKGEDLVVPAKGEPTGEDRVPTQRITLDVQERYKGNASNQIVLFKTGSDKFHLEGDPPYQVGQNTVLFLKKRKSNDGTYVVISPEGRYQINENKLAPVVNKGFPENHRGQTIAEFARLLKEAK